MKECLKDKRDAALELAGVAPMVLTKNFKLLVELYQFLPSKKSGTAA